MKEPEGGEEEPANMVTAIDRLACGYSWGLPVITRRASEKDVSAYVEVGLMGIAFLAKMGLHFVTTSR